MPFWRNRFNVSWAPASPGCQVLASPALQSGVERMLAHYADAGVDVHAYTTYLREDDEQIFLFPVTEHAAAINAVMEPVIAAVLRGEVDPAVALPAANEKVNALFDGVNIP